jgi:hypothetical protein
MRVALISQVTPAVEGYTQLLRALGHDPAGVLCVRTEGRYAEFGAHVSAVAQELDVVVPSRRERFAPLLQALEPDVAICLGFPLEADGGDDRRPPARDREHAPVAPAPAPRPGARLLGDP